MRARILAPENRKWLTLGCVSFALFMVMLDNTVVNVALPSIQQDLGIGLSELQWTVNAYALTFAVLHAHGRQAGRLLGPSLSSSAGLVVFTASSLACGLCTSGDADRRSHGAGLGSALMSPATLSIISPRFPPSSAGWRSGSGRVSPRWRSRSGRSSAALIAEHIDWSWIFFINVPIGVIGHRRRALVIRESRDTRAEQRLDLPGLADVGRRPVRADLRAHRGERVRLDVSHGSSRSSRRRHRHGRLRPARDAPARCRCSTSRSSAIRRSRARTPWCCSSGSRCSASSSSSRSTSRASSAIRRCRPARRSCR